MAADQRRRTVRMRGQLRAQLRDCRVADAIESLEGRTLFATTELLINGDFANGTTAWTATGDWHADSVYSTTNGHSNPGYAYLAKNGSVPQSLSTTGSLSQTVAVPAGIASASLSFFTKVTTEETTGSTNDQLSVRVGDLFGNTLATLQTLNAHTDSDYVFSTFDLSAYAGQSIKIIFTGATDATLGTVFRVDDVSLLATTASNAVIAPTPVLPGTLLTGSLPVSHSPIATLRWNPVTNAAGYGVVLSTGSAGPFGGSFTDVFNSETSSFASPIAGNSFTVPKSLSAGTYRWHVRSFDASGTATGYSPWMYFTVAPTGYTRAVGIDISHYQTVSSWNSIKTNGTTSTTADDTSFLYIKATEGTGYIDPTFASFSSGAAAAGLPFGAYHYARPDNNTAASEATYFYNTIKSKLVTGNLVPMLDFEEPSIETTSQGAAALSKWVNDFEAKFSSLSGGIVPIVYTFVSYASSYLDTSVIKYPLWQAQYPTSAANPTIPNTTSSNPSGTSPWPSQAWAMWQYTSNRTVAGISSGNVDADVANSDPATYYAQFGIRSTAKGSIGGNLFNDADHDGVHDAGEAGIPQRTVWIDADDDGVLDNGEPSLLTNANGDYTFTNLPEGAYRIRQIIPSGSNGTLPTGTSPRTIALTAGQASTANDFGAFVPDSTPPTVTGTTFDYASPANTLTITLSEDVGGSLSAADISLVDSLGASVPFTFAFDPASLTATVTPSATLANGSYRLAITSSSFSDVAGNANAGYAYDFFQLQGDANRDRAVDFSDLLIVAKNFGQSGKTFADGDLDGNGSVDFSDLLILAKNYGGSAPVIAPAASFAMQPATSMTAATRKRVSVLT